MTSTTVDTYMVASDHYTPVNPLDGSATVKVLTGSTVYYADQPYVTSTTNLGSLTSGQSATFTRPAWLLSAKLSSVSVTITGTGDAADAAAVATAEAASDPVGSAAAAQAAAIAAAEAASVLRDGTGMPASVANVSRYVAANGATDGTAINAAITAISGNGDILLGPGTFVIDTPILMPRSSTGFRLRGAGRGATILQPTLAAKRVVDFPHVADGDTYQNVTLSDFSIDATNLTVPANNQSLIGNLLNGNWQNRVNFNNIRCYRISVANLVTNATASNGMYQAFSFGSMQGGSSVAAGSNGVDVTTFAGAGTLNTVTSGGFPASGQLLVDTSTGTATLSYTGTSGGNSFTGVNLVSGTGTLATGGRVMEATQNVLTNFTWEDLTVLGGNDGFVTIANQISGALAGVNVFYDEINWNRCYHDGLTVPTAANFNLGGGQVGGSAFGGTVRWNACVFKNALDVYEIDTPQTAYITNCLSVDARNANFFVRNFNKPQYPNSQTIVWHNCHAKVLNVQPTATTTASSGWMIGHTTLPNPTVGHAILSHCTFSTAAPQQTGGGQAINANGTLVSRITINDFTASVENCADTSTSSQHPSLLLIQPACAFRLQARNIAIKVNGSTTNASWGPQWVILGIASYSGSSVYSHFSIDGLSLEGTVTGVTSGNTQLVIVAGGGGVTWGGLFRRFQWGTFSGDTNPKGITIPTNAAYPIDSKSSLVIRDVDFSQKVGGYDVNLQDATQKALVFFYNNRWGTGGPSDPAGGTTKIRNATNAYFASTTFTTATGNRYLGGFAGRVLISAGSGVTAVDISQDGGSNYDNLLTQSAAAIPQTIIARIENGDLLKLTFTTTAPTVVVLPDK